MRAIASKKKLLLGCAIPTTALDDPSFLKLVEDNFNCVYPEGAFKFRSIAKSKESWDFSASDRFMQWAVAGNLTVRGHCLVWHKALPDWLEPMPKKQALETLERWIFTMVQQRYGTVKIWDVVNEAIADNGLLRQDSWWHQNCGDDYLYYAFKFAQEANPDAKLFYCDYRIDVTSKWEVILAQLLQLRKRGIKNLGVAIQLHATILQAWKLKELKTWVKRFRNEGFLVHCPESTIWTEQRGFPFPKGLIREEAQAHAYKQLMQDAIASGAEMFGFWSVSDSYPWCWNGDKNELPGLWGKTHKPKSSFHAIEAALQASTTLNSKVK